VELSIATSDCVVVRRGRICGTERNVQGSVVASESCKIFRHQVNRIDSSVDGRTECDGNGGERSTSTRSSTSSRVWWRENHKLEYEPTATNVADLLTKPLGGNKIAQLRA
jgi:hypothetical protein